MPSISISPQQSLAVILALHCSLGWAAAPAIGVASAKGTFRLDNASVTGNGTLFDGSSIETSAVASQLRLASGASVQLGASSRGRIYRDRLVLERGAGRLDNASGFGLEAGGLRVLADQAGATGEVAVRGANRILVSALAGNFRVTNASGVLLASLPPGRALEFTTQTAGASPPSRLTGCVVKKDGRFFLTDEATQLTVELQGSIVERHAGHKVEITGSQIPGAKPAGNATQLIQVAGLKELSKKCSAAALVAAGGAAGGAAAGGAAAGAGISTAVVAGVVVAGAAAGTAIAITATGDEEPASLSR